MKKATENISASLTVKRKPMEKDVTPSGKKTEDVIPSGKKSDFSTPAMTLTDSLALGLQMPIEELLSLSKQVHYISLLNLDLH